MFSVEFSEEALRQPKKLENQEARRILEKLRQARRNPLRYFERLSGRDECKLRVGDYRVIANVMQESRKILVRSLSHRKNIYEKR